MENLFAQGSTFFKPLVHEHKHKQHTGRKVLLRSTLCKEIDLKKAQITKRLRHAMRQVALSALLSLFCQDMSHKFKPVLICATDHSDKDFHMSHDLRFVAATCHGNVSQRFVA